ncbi:MAG: tRNA uridine-5-carboxymethylaminomethyl(34) synthesis enzyme MnmG [Oscillospiraceae bacterium]|nr:tRNA uridine-5-carboxymethylaminomethyl(34) synthesis enzyme MnmG [Oscillospiraceae bacterium]
MIIGEYDIAVIGAGHAGCEAALAGARLGCSVLLLTMSLDSIANMPCNPSIGGSAKGHLVREIDALGGQMGKQADLTMLQFRMLNLGKGAAVHSPRAQIDRMFYHQSMKSVLEQQENLDLGQAEVKSITVDRNNSVKTIVTHLGSEYLVKTVIICTGTILNSTIFVGDKMFSGGPAGSRAASGLSESLLGFGLNLRRLKTGTPARLLRRSIDFGNLAEQKGDENIIPFSFETKGKLTNKVVCHIVYTNEVTHEIVRKNIEKSAIYSGNIKGVGPRYCPSIEDKIVRFPDKKRHQLFIEPMGLSTEEMYIQGMSTSMPEDVQVLLYRSLEGFENAQVMRPAYAIEYDCCDPLDLLPTLETKKIGGLFGSGQFNGTSGYEEAAAQGLIAGINAAQKVLGKEMLVLPRSSSYIGTLIDDLVTKGCEEPYRMMTSRSEYRLLLRQDNADERLTPTGRRLGLIGDERWRDFLGKMSKIQEECAWLEKTTIPPCEKLDNLLTQFDSEKAHSGISLKDLLKRPDIMYADAIDLWTGITGEKRSELSKSVIERVEIDVKYEGYISRQRVQAERLKKSETKVLPAEIDYSEIGSLRLEAREKLNKVKPQNIGQASRISGVNPADISNLLVWLFKNRGRQD